MNDLRVANKLLRDGFYEKALDAYLDLIHIESSYPILIQNIALCFKKQGMLELFKSTISISNRILSPNSSSIEVSIIIPGYRNSESIIKMLDRLQTQTHRNFEVIVVSDGCDEVVERVKSYVSDFSVSLYNTSYTNGFGVMLARNIGAAKAVGKILIFVDPDVILPGNFVSGIVNAFEEHSLILPKVHFVDESNHNKIILRENRKGFKDPTSPIMGFATQCCAISRASFLSLGGFDEKLIGQGGSDTDFGLRHALIHNKAIYLNDVICHHIGLSSGKKYHVGEESRWERKTYNYRKKSDFYSIKSNSIANEGIKYFLSPRWESYRNLIDNKVQLGFVVATVVSDLNNYGYVNYLKPSASFYNLKFITLVADESAISRKTGSLSEKDRLLMNLVERVDDETIIMFVDGYDTVICSNKDEIVNKFLSYNVPLVVSAELNCHPDQELASYFPESEYGAKYLNTGGFIGYAWAIKEMIMKARKVNVPDNRKLQLSNQYRWIRVFLENQNNVKLDNSSSLFFSASTKKSSRTFKKFAKKYSHTLYNNQDFANEEMKNIFKMMTESGNRVSTVESSELPCVVHWNGPASIFMESFSDRFGFLRPWETRK